MQQTRKQARPDNTAGQDSDAGRGDVGLKTHHRIAASRITASRLAASLVLAAAIGAAGALPVHAVTSAPVAPASTPASSAAAKTVKVRVGDNFFKPKKLKVAVGDTVVWRWIGSAIHDVTVKKGPQKFESEKQSSGKFSQVISEPGKYRIVCTVHPGMEMKMTAKAPAPTTTTTAPAAP